MAATVNATSILKDVGGSNLRFIANEYTFQTWGAAQSSNVTLNTLVAGASNVTVMTVTGSNIGIGTTAPRARLDIVQNSNIPGLVVDQYGTGDALQVRDGGAVKMVVDANGNVGIGTATPSEKLHVDGPMTCRVVNNSWMPPVRKMFTVPAGAYLDVSTAGNTGAKGFRGGFTDGRYAYLVPYDNGAVRHGILTRVDLNTYTTAGVTYLDVSTAGNTSAKAFFGGFTDGRYAYLVPDNNGAGQHGILTRVDLNSYTTAGVTYLDVSTAGNTNAKGFRGGFTDGRYAYLVPFDNGAFNGILTRVDLTTYTTAGVTYLDVSTAGNTGAKGFQGGFTDGRYAYLVPQYNGTQHGILTRVDLNTYTTAGVTYLDVSTAGNTGAKGFVSGFTDGRYVYLVPYDNGVANGILTRVDLNTYTTAGVTYLDVSTAGNTGAKGFRGGFTDGRYAYLVPSNNGARHGIFTRVDLNTYTTAGVAYLDVSTAGNTGAKGFHGGFTDGRYAYLVPENNGANHGILTRALVGDIFPQGF